MKGASKESFIALIKGVWDATKGERPRFFLFCILFIIAYSVDLLTPVALAYSLSAFARYQGPDAFHHALLGVEGYFAVRILYTICHHSARYIQNRVAYSSRMNMLSKLFDALMVFPLRWHIGHHSGETLSKLNRSVGAVDSVIATFVWQILEGVVKVVFAGIAIVALDFMIGINLLVISALTIAAMIFFNRKLVPLWRRFNTFYNKINRICVDYLFNIVTVKTLSVETSAKRHLRTQKAEGLIHSQNIAKFMELKWAMVSCGYAVVISSSLIIYFHGTPQGDVASFIGAGYVLIDYLNRIFQAIGSFTGYYSGLIESATAYEDAVEIITLSAKTPERSDDGRLNSKWNSVNIRRLNFSYIPGEKIGLNNVDFEFKRGEKIALVGQSGSGKSTLLKVFGGLLAPDSYSLSTDVQPTLAIEDFIPHCLLIPQEPEIFSETVIYNLTMGDEFDPKEVAFFVSLCKFDELLSKLPHGLDSSLAEKGLNLSVGEKQRVALARGLLRVSGKEVLLLDEPTSSLDPKTEREIFLGVLYHFSSRTVLCSCHRLNLIPLFDKIVFMAQSQVVEIGTFEDLVERKGYFYRAWTDYERNIKTQNQAQPEEGPELAPS